MLRDLRSQQEVSEVMLFLKAEVSPTGTVWTHNQSSQSVLVMIVTSSSYQNVSKRTHNFSAQPTAKTGMKTH